MNIPATLSSTSLPSSETRPNSSESNVDILGVRTTIKTILSI